MSIGAIRLIHLGRLHAPARIVFRPHAHACHELVVPLRGRLRAEAGRRFAEAGPGCLLWYPAGCEHRESVVGHGSCDWFWLLIEAAEGGGWPLVLTDRAGVARQLCGLIADAAADPGRFAEAKRQALAAALMAELAALAGAGTELRPDELVGQADQWMRRHLDEGIDLSSMAAALGLSRAHFARAYRARRGLPPMEALRELRLAAARCLLMEGDLPLATVAERCGFGSKQLLSRWLQRRFGCGARALRRGARKIGLT